MINLFRKSSVKKSLIVSFYFFIDFLKIELHFPFVGDWEVAIQRNSDPSALAPVFEVLAGAAQGGLGPHPWRWHSVQSSEQL